MGKNGAVLLIGGKGERFESHLPKQFHRISGKRIYLYALETLIASNLFEEIVLVAETKWHQLILSEIPRSSKAIIKLTEAGKSRQASSYQGILALSQAIECVLIHDGVRPFISEKILKENIQLAYQIGAVDTCIPTTDTLVQSTDQSFIDCIPERSHFLRGQTPQTFLVPIIKKGHESALKEGILTTCDCSLVKRLNLPIGIIKGEELNIKITSELDLFLAEQLLRKKQQEITDSQDSLEGKTFALTGSSGTIGREIATSLKEAGAIVLEISRSSQEFPCDLTNQEQCRNIFDKIFSSYGCIDGLINCVGLLSNKSFLNHSLDEVEELIRANLMSVLYSCYFAKVKRGGHIINFASSSYIKGREQLATYSATKAAIVNFSQGLAEEEKELQVNVIAPKRTLSSMRESTFGKEDEKDLLNPSVIAQTTLNLLKNKTLTGNVIRIY